MRRPPASRALRSAESRRGGGRGGAPDGPGRPAAGAGAVVLQPFLSGWPGRRRRYSLAATGKGAAMHDTTALAKPNARIYLPAENPRFAALHRRFPTVA